MNIYQIDQAILSLIDMETGELLDYEQFEALNMERDTKIENMCLWVKELTAEAAAIRAEELALAARRRISENKAERLKKYLTEILQGEAWKSPKAAASFRKNSAVEVDADFVEWASVNAPDLLTFKEPEVSKTAVKDYLKAGNTLDHARIVERLSMSIK